MGLSIKNPLVVGYKGEIGSFILQGLLKIMPKALDIWCFDVNETEKEKVERIKKSDLIFLCVPMKDTVRWLRKYEKILKGKTVIEQTSLKEWIPVFFKKPNFTLLSMHILFRPSATPNKEDREVLLILNSKWKPNWSYCLEDLIKEITEAKIDHIGSVKEHDILMASNQALVHRILLTLDKKLINYPQTYIGKRIKELVRRIRQGNKELYEIIQNNTYLKDELDDFNKKLKSFDIGKEF